MALSSCPGVWYSELRLSEGNNHRVIAEGTVTMGHRLEFWTVDKMKRGGMWRGRGRGCEGAPPP